MFRDPAFCYARNTLEAKTRMLQIAAIINELLSGSIELTLKSQLVLLSTLPTR